MLAKHSSDEDFSSNLVNDPEKFLQPNSPNSQTKEIVNQDMQTLVVYAERARETYIKEQKFFNRKVFSIE